MFIALVSDNLPSSVGAKYGRCRSYGAWHSSLMTSYKHFAPNGADFLDSFSRLPFALFHLLAPFADQLGSVFASTNSEGNGDSNGSCTQ
jgi:hypothetical protein